MKQTNHPNNLSDFFDPYEDDLELQAIVQHADFLLYHKDIKHLYARQTGSHIHEILYSDSVFDRFYDFKDDIMKEIDDCLASLEEYEQFELCDKLFKKRKQYWKELEQYERLLNGHSGLPLDYL